jgi:hypothetical protein
VDAVETEVQVPLPLAFGMREREKRMVFKHLPLLSADMSTRREMNALRRVNAEEMAACHGGALAAGVTSMQADAMSICAMRTRLGSRFENRLRVIEASSEPGKPNDKPVGRRSEVRVCFLYFCTGFRSPLFTLGFIPLLGREVW